MLTGKPSDILHRWATAMLDPHDGTEPDVPCGTCSACCRSGYTIDLEPGESGDGLDVVERDGKRVLRKNPDGSCVHVTDTGCSVYDRRPITCRRFDCRVFGLAGLIASGDHRRRLNEAILSWEFDLSDDEDVIRALAFRLAIRGIDSPNMETTIVKAYPVTFLFMGQSRQLWQSYSDDERMACRQALASPRSESPC